MSQINTESYEHQFDRVEDYLHHRPPYLLVERIVSISKFEIVTGKQVSGEEFFLAGHFPGAPVFPGAMLQELTTQTAGILIAARHNPMREYNTHDPDFNLYALGVLVKVRNARYKGLVRPGDELEVTVTLNDRAGELFDFSATVKTDGHAVMRNQFQLMNIESDKLTDRRP